MYVDNETLLIWLNLYEWRRVVRIESWYKFMSKVYELNLVEIYGARLNRSEKFKKTQGFPFFGPSPGRERFSRGRRGTTARGREEGWKKSGERSFFLTWY